MFATPSSSIKSGKLTLTASKHTLFIFLGAVGKLCRGSKKEETTVKRSNVPLERLRADHALT